MTEPTAGVLDERAIAFDRTYAILDHVVRVRTNVPEFGALLDRYLERFVAAPDEGATSYWVVGSEEGLRAFRGEEQLREGSSGVPGMLDILLWHLHTDAMEKVDRYLSIHASAAAWGGQGMVLPAPMDSGKTTTIAGLVRAGFDYLTDEAALIHPRTLMLHPYPKALTFEEPSMEVIPELQGTLPPQMEWGSRIRYHIRPEDLRPDPVSGPVPIRFVVSPRYVAGSTTQLMPISRAEAVVMLAENCFNFDAFKGQALETLARVVEGAETYVLRIGNLEEAVAAVRDLVDRER